MYNESRVEDKTPQNSGKKVRKTRGSVGSIAQLGEHMPYKHGVTGSSPVVPTNLARWCSRLARQPVTLEVDGSSPFRVAIFTVPSFGTYASVAQLVEQRTENPRVVGSIPTGGTISFESTFERNRKAALNNVPVAHCNRRGFSAEKRFRPEAPLLKGLIRKKLLDKPGRM